MRAGVFQSAARAGSPSERLNALAAALERQSLDLLVCPELFMSGYHVGDALREHAESRDGAFARGVSALARRYATAIVYGYPERDGAALHNAAACIDREGRLIAHHRKTVLPPGFESSRFEPGDGFTSVELDGWRCRLLICYEAEFPEAARAAAEDGVQALLVPTALSDDWPSVAHRLIPTRAFENGLWLLYANHCGEEHGLRYLGGSCIVAPDGDDVVRAGSEEMVIVADLRLDDVLTARERLPYLDDIATLRGKLG